MSLQLSAMTGEKITGPQLLGENDGDDKQMRVADAEQDLKKLMRKMRKAGLAAAPKKGS